MPTEIELSRRTLLCAAALWPAWPVHAASRPTRLLAAWDEPGTEGEPRHRIGLIDLDAARGRTTVHAAIDVPTRAHGLAWEPERGSVLAVARRPGDWLLRWWPQRRGAPATQWHWVAPQRRFNGHALRIGERVLTTETDFDADGAPGVVVVRDATTLEEVEVWPTHGRDPHALLADGRGLWVANGGIGTDLTTGRTKVLQAMDSSLVRLDLATGGALRGQWRLPDARLSLRHLARGADSSLGIALQAEHDDAARRAAAPLLALWRDGALRAIDPEHAPAGGYGGDIAALGERYFVSATRAGRLLSWSAREGWAAASPIETAGALAIAGDALWCGAARGWVPALAAPRTPAGAARPDNHAVGIG